MASDDEWAAPASDAEAEVAAGSDSDDSDANGGGDNSIDKKSKVVKKSGAKPGGKKAGKEAKAKAKGKAKPLVACFAARCDEKKAGKSKFCERHRPYFQASQYQAEKTGNMKIHNQVFSDPEKAASALLKLEKENPPGMGHRKSLVDWGQWSKSWGVRDSVKDERPEEEMDIRDYLFYQNNRGYDEATARQMWEQLIQDPRTEVFGEGAEMTAMVAMKRRRIRGRERYEQGQYQEGSKAKATADEDKERLKAFSVQSSSSVGDSAFLRGAITDLCNSASRDEPATKPEEEKIVKPKVSAGLAGPAASAKHKVQIGPLRVTIEKALIDLSESAKVYEQLNECLHGQELCSYYKMCMIRLHMLRFCLARKQMPVDLKVDGVSSTDVNMAPATPATPGTPSHASTSELSLSPGSSLSQISPTKTSEAASPSPTNSPGECEGPSVETPVFVVGGKEGDEVKEAKEGQREEAEVKTEEAKEERKPEEAGQEQKEFAGQPVSENQPFTLRDALFLNPKDLAFGQHAELESSQKVTKAYRSVVKRLPLKYSFTMNKDGLYSLWHMECSVDGMTDVDTHEELDQLKHCWIQGSLTMKELADSVKQCARKLKSACDNAERARLRALSDTSRATAEEVRQLGLQRRQAAAAIRSLETAVPLLFKNQNLKKLVGGESKELDHCGTPYLCDKGLAGIEKYKTNPKTQLLLGDFGASYKKKPTYKDEGWSLDSIAKGEAKDVIMEMLKELTCIPPCTLKIDDIEDKQLKTLFGTVWLWGSNPKARFQSFTRNGLAQIKVVVSGSVRHILIDYNRLPAQHRQGEKFDDIISHIANLPDDVAKNLCDADIIMEAVVGPWQALYVPSGFLVLEETAQGSLVFGLRQSILTKSAASQSRYQALKALYVATKKGVGKMDEVLELMKP